MASKLKIYNVLFVICVLMIVLFFSCSESRVFPAQNKKQQTTLMEKAQEILLKEILRRPRSLYDVNRFAPGGPDPKHH